MTKRVTAGTRYGLLVAVKKESSVDKKSRWLWQCDCGGSKVSYTHVARKSGNCGCQTFQKKSDGLSTHKGSRSSEYVVWNKMKGRCFNPNDTHYADYGGRGISVCQRWIDSFANFYADMGDRPKNTTIERIDNNGNYEPNNCKWATRKAQQRNRRTNVMLEFNGIKKCMMDWCEELGIKFTSLRMRLKYGWSVEEALTTPIRPRCR